MPLTYLDFELEIGAGQGRDFAVVARSPAGEARATMRFPFDELALENRLKDLQIALLRSGGKRRQVLSPEQQTVRDFGKALFDALFAGEVRSRYDVSLQQARSQGKGLRIRLQAQSPAAAALPWEYLYDPRQSEYCCLSNETPLVRYVELSQPSEPLVVTAPLRVLGLVASPSDLPGLDVTQEKQRIEQATQGLRDEGRLELEWMSGQTWRDLQAALRRRSWHIFHFSGHGQFDALTDEGQLIFVNDQGRADVMPASAVGRLLANHRTLRLAWLNACEGARGGNLDIFSSTASILVRRGIPAVVAMQYEITDRGAIELARTFYEALADGYPADAALAEARVGMSLSINNTVEWGTPVLYMRAPDGRLFDMQDSLGTPVLSQQTPTPIESRSPVQPPSQPKFDRQPATREQMPPPDLDELYIEALAHFYVERWNEANALLAEIIAQQPDYPGAAAKLDRARREETLMARYAEGCAAYDAGQWTAAIEPLQAVVALDPAYREAAGRLAEAERQTALAELYSEARRLFNARAWQSVLGVFDRIREQDAIYGDPEGLLAAAHEALDAQEKQRRLSTLYAEAVRAMDAGRLVEADRGFQQVIELSPGYKQAEALLARVDLLKMRQQAEHPQVKSDSPVAIDFVDRQEALSAFAKGMAGASDSKSILLLRGAKGMGKSFLLRRLELECLQMRVSSARVDMRNPRGIDGTNIMRDVRDSLGKDEFFLFTDLLNFYTTEAYTLKLEHGATKKDAQSSGALQNQTTVGGVLTRRNAVILDNMLSMPRRDIEIDHRRMVDDLTRSFLERLITICQSRKVVCLFDDIDCLDETTAYWLWHDFIGPMIDQANFMVVMTTTATPSIDRKIHSAMSEITLGNLSEAHVFEYLERRGVTVQDRRAVADFILSDLGNGGQPDMMAHMVDLYLKPRPNT